MPALQSDLWDLFHDGSIDAVQSEQPGVLQIKVDLLYIAERFGKDIAFHVIMIGCTKCEFRAFDSGELVVDHQQIERMGLEIWSAEVDQSGTVIVLTDKGKLSLKYDTSSVHLSDGRSVSYDELADAANHAVAEWENEQKR